MAANPNDVSTDKDDALYAELDKHSKKVRDLAMELASVLAETENRSKELNLFITALSALSTCNIRNFDDSVANVKKAYAYLSFQSKGSELFGPSVPIERLPETLDVYGSFVEAVMELAEIGLKLSQESE
jgi:hypothetical protein